MNAGQATKYSPLLSNTVIKGLLLSQYGEQDSLRACQAASSRLNLAELQCLLGRPAGSIVMQQDSSLQHQTTQLKVAQPSCVAPNN